MHTCTKMITNTARLTYQYTVDPSLEPKQFTIEDSVTNFYLQNCDDVFTCFERYENCICFPCKICKLCTIEQILKINSYELCTHENYNILNVSAISTTIVKYISCHLTRHTVCTKPITIKLIVPPYINCDSIINIDFRILQLSPCKLTAHHIFFDTIIEFNITHAETN